MKSVNWQVRRDIYLGDAVSMKHMWKVGHTFERRLTEPLYRADEAILRDLEDSRFPVRMNGIFL